MRVARFKKGDLVHVRGLSLARLTSDAEPSSFPSGDLMYDFMSFTDPQGRLGLVAYEHELEPASLLERIATELEGR